MDKNFWHQRWEKNEIAFHEEAANLLLVKYFSQLSLTEDSRIFLPLCGKTLDIAWLLSNGCSVVGAELSKIAIEQLFLNLGIKPTITQAGKLEHHSAANIDVFVGDLFDLSREQLGHVDAVYDRGALVALPEMTRRRYTEHLAKITDQAPQLLICYEYQQSLMEGPPFSISNDEVKRHYGEGFNLFFLASVEVQGGLKGKCPAKENVWLLKK